MLFFWHTACTVITLAAPLIALTMIVASFAARALVAL